MSFAAPLAESGGIAYLVPMVMMPPKPRTIWNDIRSFVFRRERHSWFALVMAIAIPCFIIYLFVLDGRTNIMPTDPVIIYAESWPMDRSDEEIIERQRELALDANERIALRRQRFQEMADRLGIDYDREAAAEQERITEENRERLSRPSSETASAEDGDGDS